MNLEYDKWDKRRHPARARADRARSRGCSPGRSTSTRARSAASPVDEFRPRNEAPLVMGTPVPDARLLRRLPEPPADGGRLPLGLSRPPGPAGAGGDPDDLGRHPVPGRRGRRVRRHRPAERGGVVGRRDERPGSPRAGGTAGLPRPGRFHAELYRDDLDAADRLARRTENRRPRTAVLRAALAPAGGLLIRLTPADAPAQDRQR